jgi:hypothetical protein
MGSPAALELCSSPPNSPGIMGTISRRDAAWDSGISRQQLRRAVVAHRDELLFRLVLRGMANFYIRRGSKLIGPITAVTRPPPAR